MCLSETVCCATEQSTSGRRACSSATSCSPVGSLFYSIVAHLLLTSCSAAGLFFESEQICDDIFYELISLRVFVAIILRLVREDPPLWTRRDVYDQGAAYRAMVGVPGGLGGE